MPKGLNLKNFGRRKSSGNALDFEPEAAAAPAPAPGQSSFRVLERADKKSVTYGTQDSRASRPFNSPLHALRGKSADDLGLGPSRTVDASRNRPGWPLSGARGSGGTTNSGSSGYYESSSASARHSSTSTLPSSLDQDHHEREEELFPAKRAATTGMYQSVAVNADEPPPPPPSFTSRAARALSFGHKNGRSSKDLPQDIPPVPPPHFANGAPVYTARSHSPFRERAMTTSSYASTAVPAKTELTLNGDFGNDDDFSNMFDDLSKKEHPLPPPPVVGSFHRTDSEPMHPMYPPRTLSRNALSASPKPLKLSREDNDSPYFSDERGSNEGLVSNSALSSPNTTDGNAPGPAVEKGIANTFLGNSKSGYSRVPDRYNSPGPQRVPSGDSYSSVMDNENFQEHAYPTRQTHVDDADRWTRRVELSDPPGPTFVTSPDTSTASTSTARQTLPTTQATSGSTRPGAVSPNSSTGDSYAAESNSTTPRAGKIDLKGKGRADGAMFDSSPVGPPSRAIRPPAHQRTESGTLKKMTKAQFQALQRHDQNSAEHSEEEDLSDNDYDDDDDIERAKNMAKQRQKQEANMSLYRQQMKKVTGGGPTDLPSSSASTVRPSMDRGASAPATSGGLHFGGISGTPPTDTMKGKEDEGEDDDVPLGILQAHGFPSGSRPPTRQDANDMAHQRRTSVAGSAVLGGGAGQGNLPPFARRLPADPYFGAGLVNQSTRESLAMNSSASSVHNMPTGPMAPQMAPQPMGGHPGGLVGVIAGEERAKAARRGTPNMATGQYNSMGSMPLPQNMAMPPQMPRTMSMGNLAPPSMYGAPPVPPMPQMGGMGGMGMGQMGMMQMPQQPPVDAGQQQMQQFMQMQMQLMQNMLTMQQAQMGGPQTPQAQQPQQQAGDYLGVNFNNMQRPMSVASQNSQFQPQPPNQGRAMTMMNPPPNWNNAPQPGGPRPNSAMPLGNGMSNGNSYAPSVNGLNISGGGPGPGYTPSIAPSERSNVGMPSRYRPVTQNGEASRSQSMTSSLTLQAFQKQQTSPNLPGTPFNASQVQTPKSTIRVVDRPKNEPKVTARPVDEDEEEGWAEMRKKRETKKKSKWSRSDKTASSSTNNANEPSLSDLYQGLE